MSDSKYEMYTDAANKAVGNVMRKFKVYIDKYPASEACRRHVLDIEKVKAKHEELMDTEPRYAVKLERREVLGTALKLDAPHGWEHADEVDEVFAGLLRQGKALHKEKEDKRAASKVERAQRASVRRENERVCARAKTKERLSIERDQQVALRSLAVFVANTHLSERTDTSELNELVAAALEAFGQRWLTREDAESIINGTERTVEDLAGALPAGWVVNNE